MRLALFLGAAWAADSGAAEPAEATRIQASYKARLEVLFDESANKTEDFMKRNYVGGGFWRYQIPLREEVSLEGLQADGCHRIPEGANQDMITYCTLHELGAAGVVGEGVWRGDTRVATDLLSVEKALVEGHELLDMKAKSLDRLKGLETEAVVSRGYSQPPDKWHSTPMLQAAALSAVVKLAAAAPTESRKQTLVQRGRNLLVGLVLLFPKSAWPTTPQAFHSNGMVWEALASAQAIFADVWPVEGLRFASEFEAFFLMQMKKHKAAWSFAACRAIRLRYEATGDKKYFHLAKKAATRFFKQMATWEQNGIDQSMYTCGLLTGLTALSTVRPDVTELVSAVLKLMEKDISLYQLRPGHADEVPPTQDAIGESVREELRGGFLRDKKQLDTEQRRTTRIDDTAQCLQALWDARRLLSALGTLDMTTEEFLRLQQEEAGAGEAVGESGVDTVGGKEDAGRTEL